MTVPGQGQEPAPQHGQEPAGVTASSTAPAIPDGDSQEPTPRQEPPERYDPDYVKSLRKSEAEARKRLQEAEARLKAVDDEKLSETERLQKQVAEAGQRIADAEARYTDAVIRAAVDREATKQGAVDPDAVFALMDRSELQVGEDGTVANTEKAVKALLSAKPYLVKASDDGAPAPARTQAIPRTPRPDATAKPADIAAEEINRLRNTGRYAI